MRSAGTGQACNQGAGTKVDCLPPQLPHRPVQPLDRQRIHPPAEKLAHQADRGSGFPFALGDRVEPDAGWVGGEDALYPDLAGFFVEVLDGAAGRDDFVRRHRGIADENHLVVVRIGVQHVPGRRRLVPAAAVFLPHSLVEAIVEVEMHHVLELGPRRGKKFFGRLDVPIHRAADVEEQQHLDGVVPLRPHQDVEIALVRGALDGAVEIELLRRAGAGESAQAAQRDLDVAGAELDVAVEIAKLTLVPHFYGAEIAVGVLADAHAFGIVAVGAERRCAGCADPFLAALVTALLFGEPLAQRLEQFFQAAECLDLLLFFFGEIFLGEFFQPLDWNFRGQRVFDQVEAFEDVAEHAVELVEIALVLHQSGARQIVERLDPAVGQILLHRLDQRQIFAQRHRQAGGFELMEEGGEHRLSGSSPFPGRFIRYSSPKEKRNMHRMSAIRAGMVSLSLVSLAFFAPLHAQTSTTVGIKWEVKSRFRLFKNEDDFKYMADNHGRNGILADETALAKETNGNGWARRMVSQLCLDDDGQLLEFCTRDYSGHDASDRESIRENYLTPAEHRIGVTADGTPAGALCTWKFLTDGNDATAVVKKDRPCGDEVFDRAAYGKITSVQ